MSKDAATAATQSVRLAIDGGEPLRKVKFGPRWLFGEEERTQLTEVMDRAANAWRSGFKVREFTQAFARIYGAKHAIASGSGTGALHAAVAALNAEPGDEIITTAVTDVGTVIGVMMQNLIPVFADWHPTRFNMDAVDIERKITERTRAIIVVHLFGNPCDMKAIMDISHRYGIPVIEDCAQAHLAEVQGQKVGTFGDVACFSLGLKTLTTDQGGMTLTNDDDLAARMRGFLSKGSERVGDNWVPYARLGGFYPMSDLHAAIGLAQLSKLEEATRIRQTTAAVWDSAFAGLDGFSVPARDPEQLPVHYLYPYHIDERIAGVTLVQFVAALRAEGIADAFGPYLKGKPLHRHPLFAEQRTYGNSGYPFRDDTGTLRMDYRIQDLPVAERMLPGVGFFHLRNSFTPQDAQDVASAVKKVARYYAATAAKHSPPPTPSRMPTRDPAKTDAIEGLGSRSSVGEIDLLTLGACNDGSDAAANDQAFARALAFVETLGGRIRIPRGTYRITRPIVLERRRNVRFIGDGGNAVNRGTRIVYNGTDLNGCMDLNTAVHCVFEGIEWVVESPGCRQIVQLRAFEGGPKAISTLSIEFVGCGFRATSQADGPEVGVRLRDAAGISFRQCWFQVAPTAVLIGAPIRFPAPTISNGQCNNVVFENCQLFGDVTGERASAIAFRDCQFSGKTDGYGAKIDMGCGKNPHVLGVTVDSCFAIAGSGSPNAFFTQGTGGAGLTMTGNRIAGYSAAARINGRGGALIAGNVFAQTAHGSADVRIEPNTHGIECFGNDVHATESAGNSSIVYEGGRPQSGLILSEEIPCAFWLDRRHAGWQVLVSGEVGAISAGCHRVDYTVSLKGRSGDAFRAALFLGEERIPHSGALVQISRGGIGSATFSRVIDLASGHQIAVSLRIRRARGRSRTLVCGEDESGVDTFLQITRTP